MTKQQSLKGVRLWPTWLCLTSYLIFIVGFWPVFDPLGIAFLDPLQVPICVVLAMAIVTWPKKVWLGKNGFRYRMLVLVFLMVLLVINGLVLFISAAYSSQVGFVQMCMRIFGFVAIFVIVGLAQNNQRKTTQSMVGAACAVLVVLGGWSILSGMAMSRQAEKLAAGHPYSIRFHNHKLVSDKNLNWWRLRAVNFATSGVEGKEHPSYYFHAVLATGDDDTSYYWSKRHIRFEPVEQ